MEVRAVPAMLGTHFTMLSTILPQTQSSGGIGDLSDISLWESMSMVRGAVQPMGNG